MPYKLVDEDWWKGKVLPAVKEENEEAFKILEQLTSEYDRFGINQTRALRVASFVPSRMLSWSLNFEATPIGKEEWKRIDSALHDKGIYSLN